MLKIKKIGIENPYFLIDYSYLKNRENPEFLRIIPMVKYIRL